MINKELRDETIKGLLEIGSLEKTNVAVNSYRDPMLGVGGSFGKMNVNN